MKNLIFILAAVILGCVTTKAQLLLVPDPNHVVVHIDNMVFTVGVERTIPTYASFIEDPIRDAPTYQWTKITGNFIFGQCNWADAKITPLSPGQIEMVLHATYKDGTKVTSYVSGMAKSPERNPAPTKPTFPIFPINLEPELMP